MSFLNFPRAFTKALMTLSNSDFKSRSISAKENWSYITRV